MFTYIYSNLSQDGQAVESCDYIAYLRMLRDTLLDVKPKDCVLSFFVSISGVLLFLCFLISFPYTCNKRIHCE